MWPSNELQLDVYLSSTQGDGLQPSRSWAAVTVFDRNGHAIGLLQLCDRHEGDFDEQDLAEMQQLAQLVSGAIDPTPVPECAAPHTA